MRALDEIPAEKSPNDYKYSDTSVTISDLLNEISRQRKEFEDHILRLEREIHDLNSGQRIILTNMLKLSNS